MAEQKGKIFIISGPGGVGKDTVINELVKRNSGLLRVTNYTTHPPREGETDGVDYRFISGTEFVDMIKQGFFLEHAMPRGYYFGTPRKSIMAALENGKTVVLQVNVDGGLAIKSLLPEVTTLIFLAPPSFADLEGRMRKRHADEEAGIKKRLEEAAREINIGESKYDHVVSNPTGHPEQAVDEIEEIIYKD